MAINNPPLKAAIIGGGVIGGGWVARFLLNGWDVAVYDPDPEAERKIAAVLANARRSLPALYDTALPAEGKLVFCGSVAKAVDGARWVQESAPEQLAIKHRILAEIQQYADKNAVIGSSTSGFKPSELQEGAARPGQIVVAHPFNPVYLLPLIEIVASKQSDKAFVAAACGILRDVGLKPLVVGKEIDAHIADRLLEAVWREGLWLVNDGIATTEEIDDAIRFGFGLRWAQMGLFETYRIAGGEAGMGHFIAQFGPALKWPWTKLMNVPELTPELIAKIAAQSDAQSGALSIRELERLRDDNLVGMMRALKKSGSGAGGTLNDHEKALSRNAPTADTHALPQTVCRQVPQSWADYNGHMNEAHYLEAFAQASDAFMALIGADDAYIASGKSFFTAETHLRHLAEAKAGDTITITTRVLLAQGKKMHLFHTLYGKDGSILATCETLLIHVDLTTRRACNPDAEVTRHLQEFGDAHAKLAKPDGAGRHVGQKNG
ncbi:carnitine 3-dehydrogenase [Thalassospira mesophila]|uniref:L-carnitine dehydrogenase n=1 Tax=Thalassospira mesophila TaxID=1293891 RepID=A0A1Y2KVY1_9PROT|nr:carnitine 3-dehydrogenase [Thalassospira mesophila]OSQ36084.1 3-hydroxyacyl-CoA dehydrogenase [Thalassospira mesophila]